MQNIRKKITHKVVLALLGVTKAVASTQRSIPGKWHNLIDSIRVSSQTAHLKLIEVDEEAARDFYNMEEEFKRRIGKGKLYCDDDLETARARVESVEFQP